MQKIFDSLCNQTMKEFKIDFTHQLRSFRECLKIFGWYALAFIIIKFSFTDFDDTATFIICISFWLVTGVGLALPFHINYLSVNWNTKLIIDENLKAIQIIEGNDIYSYALNEIIVTRHILPHYRPDRTKSWIPIPCDYYGYLTINAIDKKVFYITSLMLDPFESPLPVNRTEYDVPIISKQKLNASRQTQKKLG